ncbi:MAG: 2-oxoglutarate dehydrogenase complex dihydrolipoyllysine-residue succinyltransferase [Gammaproteobacteria bacterium]|nr:MAG: 2-oxoglutarate dehydrogenase complex dihydrolipoyllysine-residue succinyltransferase [Gammaproteobacteria bacterium]
MPVEVKVPDFPESVTEGTLVAWHKQPGNTVKRDEILVDIETDKVVFELPAPEGGILVDILENDGATVLSGQVIAHINAVAGEASPLPEAAAGERESTAATPQPANDAILTPSARKLIAERDLDGSQITGTGKGGRVLKEDVLRFLEQAATAKQPIAETVAVEAEAIPIPSAETARETLTQKDRTVLEGRPEKRVAMTRLRARIAERLVEAQQTAAILSTFNEVNMQPVMDLRQRNRERFEKEHGVRLGFMSFFVKAVVEALKQFPQVNASVDGNDVVYHGFFDIGIAVGSPRGLVVPILRDADQMSMVQIESQIKEFGQKAQDSKLSMEEITGGTFTITNGGVFGSLLSTPILNPPQSGILGMHKIQPRPMVENGEIVIRPMMYLALSYDHRIIDGREAVLFLITIKELLEDPARMLLEV